MGYSAEERAIIWLCTREDLDYRERVALLRAAKNPAELLSDWEKFYRSVIKNAEGRVYNSDRLSRERQADEALSALGREECFAVTLMSDDYPESLKAIPDPPLVLFGKGNRKLLKKEKFCIVGSRITPPWAEKQARVISETLSRKFVIVTGFAEGGDRAAAEGALRSGNLICVFPLGLDGCYPSAHIDFKKKVRENGLLLSEYPLGTELRKYHFQARNRILAGLCRGTLVVSAKENRSGALITASYAADYGRDVFAFPYNPGISQGSGCNSLIKKGACLVTGAEDILFSYGMTVEEEKRVALSEEEARVLDILRENGELHAAVIAERAGMQIYEAAAALSSLEMKNLAVKAGGNRYSAL